MEIPKSPYLSFSPLPGQLSWLHVSCQHVQAPKTGLGDRMKCAHDAQGHYEMTAPAPKSGQHRITLAEKTFMLRVKAWQTALLR